MTEKFSNRAPGEHNVFQDALSIEVLESLGMSDRRYLWEIVAKRIRMDLYSLE